VVNREHENKGRLSEENHFHRPLKSRYEKKSLGEGQKIPHESAQARRFQSVRHWNRRAARARKGGCTGDGKKKGKGKKRKRGGGQKIEQRNMRAGNREYRTQTNSLVYKSQKPTTREL